MDTLSAFAMGEAFRGCEQKVFDWDKAAHLIHTNKPKLAIAGLLEDMEYTSGVIYEDDNLVRNDYTYLSSTWATPVIVMDGKPIECYKMQSEVPKWNEDTKWPSSALKILRGEG